MVYIDDLDVDVDVDVDVLGCIDNFLFTFQIMSHQFCSSCKAV